MSMSALHGAFLCFLRRHKQNLYKSSAMFNLRIKTKNGAVFPLTDCVSGESTFADLQVAILSVTDIFPEQQKILTGFPPKPLTAKNEDSLSTLNIKNGEVIIVEDLPKEVNVSLSSASKNLNDVTSAQDPFTTPEMDNISSDINNELASPCQGILLKKVVPSDNSCLFASIYYLVNGGLLDTKDLKEMRQLVASAVALSPEVYNEGVLEKSNVEYCKWIMKSTSWGGAIELAILSQYYGMEIVAIDAKTGLLNCFGEDQKYDERMLVMYDGIHYDPLYMETFDGRVLTVFPTTDNSVLSQAGEIATEARRSGQFTDTAGFSLKCLECGFVMRGEKEAVGHAKNTGHSKFDEVHQS